ncbi:G-type lectin S-receptor-like serine/threonine-protein kinase SD2-5 [Asparagus officinalis]|uniref:G-type lectin S-receptor-like serine/threonine-protein kinase SD2-5 n=1 Tax=Asparagus officinalis TaxID=4686 RepID=UPI00098E6861|nr:G-type lectin S-receptor-like serine/threonine-protein kinase SD2-5 [Asparagus officinalis]
MDQSPRPPWVVASQGRGRDRGDRLTWKLVAAVVALAIEGDSRAAFVGPSLLPAIMLMRYRLILCSALVSLHAFPGGALNATTLRPPAVWTNNDSSLNRSSSPGSLVRVVLSLPISDIPHDYLGSGGPPARPANRVRPVGENATLHFSQDVGLSLRDADGTLVWSSNTAGKSVVGMRLSKEGRLELFDGSNASTWDSFDYPTDSWLPGQTLKEGQRLTANVSATDWNRGQFYLSVVSGGLEAYVDSYPPQLYYQHKNSSWSAPTHITFTDGSLIMSSDSTDINGSLIDLIVTTGVSSLQFIRLDSDGHLRHYGWDTDGWASFDVFLKSDPRFGSSQRDDCTYPTVCGEYGLCSNGDCTCPNFTYFRQLDERRVNLGCYPVTPLSCQSTNNHQLLPLANVSYFIYNDLTAGSFTSTDEQQCKQGCLRNCSCKAVFFKFTNDSSNGSCYLPSRLYSLSYNDPQISGYNSSAYIKVQIQKKVQIPNKRTGFEEQIQKKRTRLAIILGVTLAGLFAAAIVIGCIVLTIKRKITSEAEKEDNFELTSYLPTIFSFEDLKAATENFSRELGKGGFGSVFEGTLGGQRVAVKRLEGVGQGAKEFLAEVKTIGNVHHINLVRLIGFCSEKSHRLLVYEYMFNGSLDKWIFYKNGDDPLDWQTRVEIITDVAKGLSYLHEDCRQRIAHLDIKPQNILLDEGFHAKISDFGLSKLIERDQSHAWTTMRGTRGYLAPEWLTSKITEKADVYSFGVVVMEIVCGRKNLDYSQPEECIHLISLLREKVRQNRLLDIVDYRNNNMQLHTYEIVEMIRLAMWCLQNDSARRPSMTVVLKVLEGSIKVETDIEDRFTDPTPQIAENIDGLCASASQSASILSGGR